MSNQIIKNKRIIALAIIILLIALLPLFIHSMYYLDLFINVLINAVLAISFIMLLRAGLISLGLAAFMGVGAYASATFAMKFSIPVWFCIPLATLFTALFALGAGFILIKSSGFTFLMLTAVFGLLFTVTIGNIPYLGGHDGILGIPRPEPIAIPFLPIIDFSTKEQFFYLALFLFVIVILIASAFYSAWTGRAWTAIGLNTRLAESIGIDIFKYKLLSFVVSSGLMGLMGSFYAHYAGFIIADSFGFFVTMNAQVMAILGGIGYAIAGPLVGSIIMTLFPELMRITREIAPIIVGTLLILLVMFLPRGLLGLLDRRPAGIVNIKTTVDSMLHKK